MSVLHHICRRGAFLDYPCNCFSRSLFRANRNQNPQ